MSTKELVKPVAVERAYWVVVILPLLAVAAVIGFGVLQETFAKREFRDLVARHVSNNEPVGNPSLTKFFDAETTRENSEKWQKITAAANAVMGKYDGSTVAEMDRLVPANSQWKASAFAQELSDASQPILDELRKLDHNDKAVWVPILFGGIDTRYEAVLESRVLARLIINEFRVAYNMGDTKRAAEVLELLRVLTQATDWQCTAITAFGHAAIVDLRRLLICQSLANEFWTEDQLQQLRDTLKPNGDLDKRWRNMVAGERAFLSSIVGGGESTELSIRSVVFDGRPLAPFGYAHVHLTATLSSLDTIASQTGAGTYQHKGAVDQWQVDQGSRLREHVSINGIPFALGNQFSDYYLPHLRSAGEAFVRWENRRRWALTAIAIKQFQLQEKRWPRSLDELDRVGWTASDTVSENNYGSKPFGYQVVEHDGDNHAILWTANEVKQEGYVSPSPPEEHDPNQPQATVYIR